VRLRQRLLLLLLVVGPWLTPVAAHAAAAPTATATTEQWRVFEITLTSTQSYANPFTDVSVTAVFTSPSGLTLQRPAFWDGGDTWKVRVCPNSPLDLSRQCQRPGQQRFEHAPPPSGILTGRQAIYAHGLQVSPNHAIWRRRWHALFCWGDALLWISTGVGTPNDPRWCHNSALVDRRVAQVQRVPKRHLAVAAYSRREVGERINPDYFATSWTLLAYRRSGLVNALASVSATAIATRPPRAAGAFWWRVTAPPHGLINGGEVAGYDPAPAGGWREVALAIDAADDYHQPQSAHYTNSFPTYYQGESWLDFTMVQGGHAGLANTASYRAYYQAANPVPLLEAESNYEGLFPDITPAVVRATAYRAIQSGSFGYTYGAQGIWNATWDAADTVNDFTSAHWNWNQAIDFPGGAQMAYLARFYRRLPWATLTPRPVGWGEFPIDLADADRPLVTADNAAQNVVVYFPATYDPVDVAGNLVNLPDQTYQVRWYNPRTGQWLYQGAARLGAGQWRIEPKPDTDDWLLWLHASRPAEADPDLALAAAQPNLAAGQPSVSSTNTGPEHNAALAADGDPATYWQPAATETYAAHWLEIDFGRPTH
jgi:hypothetical protein